MAGPPVLDDLADVVSEFDLAGEIMVKRVLDSGFDAEGHGKENRVRRFKMNPVVVHPASERDLMSLPEGQRTKETIMVFTNDRLQTALEGGGRGADVIEYAGEDWKIVRAGDWSRQNGAYRSMAQKHEVN